MTFQLSFEETKVCSSVGSGILSRISGVEKALNSANSPAAVFAGHFGRFALPVAKEKKRGLSLGLFTHEEHRNMRVQQNQGHRLAQFVSAQNGRQPLTSARLPT